MWDKLIVMLTNQRSAVPTKCPNACHFSPKQKHSCTLGKSRVYFNCPTCAAAASFYIVSKQTIELSLSNSLCVSCFLCVFFVLPNRIVSITIAPIRQPKCARKGDFLGIKRSISSLQYCASHNNMKLFLHGK